MSHGRFIFALAALAAVLLASPGAATAKTFSHGHTVWFDDVTLGAGDEVRGDLEVVFGNVSCGDGAVIDGNVRTFFGNFSELDGCRVGGRVLEAFNADNFAVLPFMSHGMALDVAAQNRKLLGRVTWDIVVLFVFLLFPLRMRIALDRVERHPALCAAAGTMALVAIVPLTVLLLLSIVGIPLIVLEFAALAGGIFVGQGAVALLVGRRLYELIVPHATASPLGALLLGLVIVNAAQSVPLVGWVVTLLVLIVGFGAAVLAFVRDSTFRAPAGGGVPAGRPA